MEISCRKVRRILAVTVGSAFIVAVVAVFIAERSSGWCSQLIHPIDYGPEVSSGQYVGQTESSVVSQVGRPSERRPGYVIGGPEVAQKYHDAVTCEYKRPAGTLWLVFRPVDGDMVCTESYWLPAGWVF